jgi:integral membrane sensor domain MASE1
MSMTVPMVQVGIVWMNVRNRLVLVEVSMRLAPIPVEVVPVPMMLVVDVRVGVTQSLMDVKMRMPLAHVQPHADCHQRPRQNQL